VLHAALIEARGREPDVDHECSVADPSMQRLFVSLCSRYKLEAYHHPKKRTRNLKIRAPAGFVRDVFVPLFEKMCLVISEWHFQRTGAMLRVFAAQGSGRTEE
jgi:hypothetical protein